MSFQKTFILIIINISRIWKERRNKAESVVEELRNDFKKGNSKRKKFGIQKL